MSATPPRADLIDRSLTVTGRGYALGYRTGYFSASHGEFDSVAGALDAPDMIPAGSCRRMLDSGPGYPSIGTSSWRD